MRAVDAIMECLKAEGVEHVFGIPGGANLPTYDALYDAQAVEVDRDARVEIIHEMQRILVEDVPYVIPYYYGTIEAWRTDTFTGWLEDDPTLGLEDPSSLTVIRPAE